ncbi:nitroreductase family protein [candidate division WOR-3 bacterium]|nr:nitroreductase family protein [candidate division WOR-3 bacterium]
MIKGLIKKNRSVRRFKKGFKITKKTLTELVDLARLSASAANLQPLKYVLSCDEEKNNKIFPHIKWAGYLTDWDGPAPNERPSAFILILGDTEITKSFGCDHGIAAQNILLGATDKGLGGCIVGALKRKALHEILNIPTRYEILLAVALGKPDEEVVIETACNGDIKYWRDEQDVMHVPKRPTEELILDL